MVTGQYGTEYGCFQAEALVDAFYVFNATEKNPNAGMGDMEFVAECILLGPHRGEWLENAGLEDVAAED